MSKLATNSNFAVKFLELVHASNIMDKFTMPGFDMNALIEMQRKNIAMFAAVNQTACESLQTLFLRQGELIRQGFEETTALMNTITMAQTPQEKIMHQAKALKTVVNNCMANTADANETYAKYSTQVIKTVNVHMDEGLGEFRGLTKTNLAA